MLQSPHIKLRPWVFFDNVRRTRHPPAVISLSPYFFAGDRIDALHRDAGSHQSRAVLRSQIFCCGNGAMMPAARRLRLPGLLWRFFMLAMLASTSAPAHLVARECQERAWIIHPVDDLGNALPASSV